VSKAVVKKWDYTDSVAKVKPLVMKWGGLTIEMLGELHAAREALSREGRPPETGTDVPVRTWDGYCTDIGLEKRTANRWLKMYDEPDTVEGLITKFLSHYTGGKK
jgi:hypothetical protein